MPATLKDVAELAGVSIATVSYVLNNGPRPVSAETRELVLEAMSQLKYQPRRKRKTEATTENFTVGIIVPQTNSTFFGAAIEGIEKFFYSRGHHCIVSSTHSDVTIEKSLIRKLTKLVDGLIVTPTAELYPEIEHLPGLGIPTVIMDRQVPTTHLNAVGIDNYSIPVQAVDFLFHAGYEKIALINGPASIDTMKVRLEGYKDTLKALGIPFNPKWCVEIDFTVEAGRHAALDLMSLHNPPDAVICTIADVVVGVLQGFDQLGIRLPGDVALVCYGDTIWTPFLDPAITVVDAPAGLMGETSARLLLNALSSPSVSDTKQILLDTRLILRDSHRRQRNPVNNRTV